MRTSKPIIALSLGLVLLMLGASANARMFGATLCKTEGYTCHKVKRGESWRSLWPDDQMRDIVMRVNRLNISLYPGLVIAVPDNIETADVMDHSPFPRQSETTEKEIIVDPNLNAWGAYDSGGILVKWGPLSAGGNWCKELGRSCHTTAGTYRIFSLGSSSCYSRKYPMPRGGAPMPYCMFFNNGQALHGSPNGLVGYNASHGCVRLSVSDAEWLRYDFVEGPTAANSYRGTRVVVKAYDYEEPSEPKVSKKRRRQQQSELDEPTKYEKFFDEPQMAY